MNQLLKCLVSLGVGLVPGARGTYGSLLTLGAAVLWLARGGAPLSGWWYLLLLAGVTALALAATALALARRVFGQDQDPGPIVIDEAAGQLLALYGLGGLLWWQMGLAFAAFRFFDIVKPWPVDRLQDLPGAWGVVIDDLMAGAYALAMVELARWGVVHLGPLLSCAGR